MNIFFTGAVRGGRAQQPEYKHTVEALRSYGTIHSSHVSSDSLSEYGETNVAARIVLDRELKTLSTCDVMVADVTTPSLGVGYLIATAVERKKRVLALFGKKDTLTLSAIIKGNPAIELHSYETEEDIDNILVTLRSIKK